MRQVPPDPEIQRRLKQYGSPAYGYRRAGDGEIEKDLFDGALPAGWAGSPADVGKPASTAVDQGFDPPVHMGGPLVVGPGEAGPGAVGVMPPYDDHKMPVLKEEYMRRTGRGVHPGTTKVGLVAMLEEIDANKPG
jgi:hypothetical protein